MPIPAATSMVSAFVNLMALLVAQRRGAGLDPAAAAAVLRVAGQAEQQREPRTQGQEVAKKPASLVP